MSGLKAIRRRITSVKNTKQITRAMKLVSAAKLRRAQEAALAGRNFSERLIEVLRVVQANLPESEAHSNPLFQPREVKKRRVMFVAGERGLCGAYNTNVMKAVQAGEFAKGAASGIEVVCFPVGKQAGSAARRFNWVTAGSFASLGENIDSWNLKEVSEELTRDYIAGEFDELVVYYTKFISVMTQEVTRQVLLPFGKDSIAASESGKAEKNPYMTRFDPSPQELIASLLPMLLGARIRQAGLEARASEHASRMTAMDSATKNADDLITQLRLFYNRARQSAITRELIDIIGGTEAIK